MTGSEQPGHSPSGRTVCRTEHEQLSIKYEKKGHYSDEL